VEVKDGTQVYVMVPDPDSASILSIRSPRLTNPEQIDLFTKEVIEVSESDEL